MSCSEPRDKTDWFTAENFLNSRFAEGQWLSLVKQDLILRAYDILRKKYESLPEISGAIIRHFVEGTTDLVSIMEILLDLSDQHLSELMTEASGSETGMDLYLGRLIYEWGFQKLARDLPCPPYGRRR
jgi:hypothetical protein